MDSAGDVFIADSGNNRVVELPRTATGYGPQTTLPTSDLNFPGAVALDSAGDVFIADSGNSRVVELPETAAGYGSQTTLPFSGLSSDTYGVAVDSAGDVFASDYSLNGSVVELPLTATGYGEQVTLLQLLPFNQQSYPWGLALDSAGDLFVAINPSDGRVVELPLTAAGYGQPTTLPFLLLDSTLGIAVDNLRQRRDHVADGLQHRRRHPDNLAVDQRPQLHKYVKHLRSRRNCGQQLHSAGGIHPVRGRHPQRHSNSADERIDQSNRRVGWPRHRHRI